MLTLVVVTRHGGAWYEKFTSHDIFLLLQLLFLLFLFLQFHTESFYFLHCQMLGFQFTVFMLKRHKIAVSNIVIERNYGF